MYCFINTELRVVPGTSERMDGIRVGNNSISLPPLGDNGDLMSLASVSILW